MATLHRLIKYVDDLTKCSICLDDIVDPKSLPCLHTFCLKCIRGHCRNNSSGDQVNCPICRTLFAIPHPGVEQLKSNFFIEGLVEAKKGSRGAGESDGVSCEVCNGDTNPSRAATVYCSGCSQTLCGSCSKIHQKIPGGGHIIVPFGTNWKADLLKVRGSFCTVHPGNKLEIHCTTCHVNICATCSVLKHRKHDLNDIIDTYKTFSETLTRDVQLVAAKEKSFLHEIKRLDMKRKVYVDGTEHIEKALLRNADELKKHIDKAVNQMVMKLSDNKTLATKVTDSLINDIEFALAASHSFTRYSRQLLCNGKPTDVTQAYDELHARADNLMRCDLKTGGCRLPKVEVTANDVYDRVAEFIKDKSTGEFNELNAQRVMSIPIYRLQPLQQKGWSLSAHVLKGNQRTANRY